MTQARITREMANQMTKIDATTLRIISDYRAKVERLEAQLKAAGEESAQLRARITMLELQLERKAK